MTLNLVKYLAVDSDCEFSDNCNFLEQDLDNDGYSDSVMIDFSAMADISSFAHVEVELYRNGQPCASPVKTDKIDLTSEENTTGNLTITLPYNKTAGYCDVRVYLTDTMGNEDDFENTTIYLFPYNNSRADFAWERNNSNPKKISFTDLSLPSPNETIVSWNWSFGDSNYSEEQNCLHNYSNIGIFNVTLMICDSVNKTANITMQVKTFNAPPVVDFTSESDIVITNTSMSFSSHAIDVDGSIINTTWYFGDNTTGFGEEIHHEYAKSGFYSISLLVTDNDNETANITIPDYVHVVDALVDDEFNNDPEMHQWNSIPAAIDDAPDDGHVYVYTGQYDAIRISKSIHIYSEGDEVFIRGKDKIVDIEATNVTLKGFNISNGLIGIQISDSDKVAIEDCILYNNEDIGILINASTDCSIINCSIDRCDIGVKINNGSKYNVITRSTISDGVYGVYVSSSSLNWIGNPSISRPYPTDCFFTLNDYSVYLSQSDNNSILGCDIDADPYLPLPLSTYGIYLDESDNNLISTCKIYNATQRGIYIVASSGNKVEHSLMSDDKYGIYMSGSGSKNNLIAQNLITKNSEFGVYIPVESKTNNIFYNDFIENGDAQTNQSFDDNGARGEENLWCKEGNNTLTKNGLGEGNYWDDYTGEDEDQDSIGDTPYILDSSPSRREEDKVMREDSYPLMEAYGWCTGTGWE